MNDQTLNKRLLGLMGAIENNQSLIAEVVALISELTARVKELERQIKNLNERVKDLENV